MTQMDERPAYSHTSAPSVETNHSSRSANRSNFDQRIKEILEGLEDPKYPTLIATIKKNLRLFKLSGVEPWEIIGQAYEIAIKKIETGEEIPNIPAWLRTTCYNVIRDISKSEKRQTRIQDEIQSTSEASNSLLVENLIFEVDQLLTIAQDLEEEDREILVLRGKGLSWQEIATKLVEAGYEESSDSLVDKIRQRGHRVIERLRKKYSTD